VLTDPVVLRALAHPLRIKLLGYIGVSGTLTATQAAAGLGVTPAAASYHLRILARYGFVEDAGGASWRERPWRLTEAGTSFDWDDGADDPANRTLTRVIYAEWFEHLQRYQAQLEHYPADVREVSGGTEFVLYASPPEVDQVWQRIREVLEPFRDRIDPKLRPAGVAPMEFLAFIHPVLPPGEPGPAGADAPGPSR
jgi:DNA-binding transcriptional ArsR family regulator